MRQQSDQRKHAYGRINHLWKPLITRNTLDVGLISQHTACKLL